MNIESTSSSKRAIPREKRAQPDRRELAAEENSPTDSFSLSSLDQNAIILGGMSVLSALGGTAASLLGGQTPVNFVAPVLAAATAGAGLGFVLSDPNLHGSRIGTRMERRGWPMLALSLAATLPVAMGAMVGSAPIAFPILAAAAAPALVTGGVWALTETGARIYEFANS